MSKANNNDVFFTKRLKELRKLHNLTQNDVAKKLGLPRSTYSGYEKGAREAGYDVLINLARIFDVSIDYLFGITEEPKYKLETNICKVLNYSDLHWDGIPISESDITQIKNFFEKMLEVRAKGERT